MLGALSKIEKLLDRGEKIELVVDKTENLRFQADSFQHQGKQLRRKLWLQNVKIKLAMFSITFLFISCLATLLHKDTFRSPRCRFDRSFPVHRKVAIALMRLASGASLCVVSKQFGCGISIVSAIVDLFVDALLDHMQEFLKWLSTPMEMHAVKAGIEVAQGLPNCCGAIDCTHIQMGAPPHELTTNWYDRKGNYSMTLQGVVDATMRF
ncbi:hypothetical protein L7F22_066402 [Adiantum nelumboides]|nr:hypothetical protein [Adiantum nelumboides]